MSIICIQNEVYVESPLIPRNVTFEVLEYVFYSYREVMRCVHFGF